MAQATYGIVDIELGDKKYTLTPTLKAMDRFNDNWDNGLRGALAKAESFNARDLAQIIAVGADLEEPDMDALSEAIFDHGSVLVGPHVVAYLYSLLNPRAATKTAEEKPAGENKPRKTS